MANETAPTAPTAPVPIDVPVVAGSTKSDGLAYIKYSGSSPIGMWLRSIGLKRASEILAPVLDTLRREWPAILAGGGFRVQVLVRGRDYK